MAQDQQSWCNDAMANELNELQNRMRSAKATGLAMSAETFQSSLMDILCRTKYQKAMADQRPGSNPSRDDKGQDDKELEDSER